MTLRKSAIKGLLCFHCSKYGTPCSSFEPFWRSNDDVHEIFSRLCFVHIEWESFFLQTVAKQEVEALSSEITRKEEEKVFSASFVILMDTSKLCNQESKVLLGPGGKCVCCYINENKRTFQGVSLFILYDWHQQQRDFIHRSTLLLSFFEDIYVVLYRSCHWYHGRWCCECSGNGLIWMLASANQIVYSCHMKLFNGLSLLWFRFTRFWASHYSHRVKYKWV